MELSVGENLIHEYLDFSPVGTRNDDLEDNGVGEVT